MALLRPFAVVLIALSAAVAHSAGKGEYQPKPGQPGKDSLWLPTPDDVVDRMLRLARVGAKDFIVDLGSGDGRIVIVAAKRYGARGLGVEYDADLVALSRRTATREGVADKASFVKADIFQTDFSRATVLTAYMGTDVNLKLRPKILAMRPGTRVVSHNYGMGDWQPDEHEQQGASTIYLWVVPGEAAGAWQIRAGADRYELTLRQAFQRLEGFIVVGSTRTGLSDSGLRGSQIHFSAAAQAGKRYQFSGQVHQGRMTGTLTRSGERPVPFVGTRR